MPKEEPPLYQRTNAPPPPRCCFSCFSSRAVLQPQSAQTATTSRAVVGPNMQIDIPPLSKQAEEFDLVYSKCSKHDSFMRSTVCVSSMLHRIPYRRNYMKYICTISKLRSLSLRSFPIKAEIYLYKNPYKTVNVLYKIMKCLPDANIKFL